MKQLIDYRCPECAAEFCLVLRHLKGLDEVMCPACGRSLDPFGDGEGEEEAEEGEEEEDPVQ